VVAGINLLSFYGRRTIVSVTLERDGRGGDGNLSFGAGDLFLEVFDVRVREGVLGGFFVGPEAWG